MLSTRRTPAGPSPDHPLLRPLHLAAAEDPSLIISRFQDYLRINTAQPNPNYREAADFILAQASSLSLEAQTVEFVEGKAVIILKWPGTDPSLPSIMIYSYTDVVPVEHSKWAHPPFGAHLDGDGLIFARASQDMKSVGMQHLEAVRLRAGLASPNENYMAFYGKRSPWLLVIKATGFDMVKAGLRAEGEVISVNMAFLKTGTPSLTGFVMNLQPSEAEAEFDVQVPPNADHQALERRIAEEWAPITRNMTYEVNVIAVFSRPELELYYRRFLQFKQKTSVCDKHGEPILTATDSSNPWWALLEEAVRKADGKLVKPEIFPATTDSCFFRRLGLPVIGFSPMPNTPILLHDHNEFLNKGECLKGIKVSGSIIKT
ncbi:hypothetical protein CRG98_013078 [Punica granatum]|uniref:Aminoacylase-1-like n=1 Tax=Punica granatum TaxID=22663 RepID=A0A2I0KDA8_PUNGR|nr:hypothetical protein CRG98_013078 [Punica granatum]